MVSRVETGHTIHHLNLYKILYDTFYTMCSYKPTGRARIPIF